MICGYMAVPSSLASDLMRAVQEARAGRPFISMSSSAFA
jgi:hypothetical protein